MGAGSGRRTNRTAPLRTSSRSALLAAPASNSRVAVAHAPPCSPRYFEEPPLPGGPVQVRYAPFFDKRPLDRGGFGGGGDKGYAPLRLSRPQPLGPERAPQARASDEVSPVVGPAGCGVQHPVEARVEAWREGGAQHDWQRHGGCLRDPPAKLDEVGLE